MKKPTINTLVSGYASNTQLNAIFENILDAFDNTVSRDGSTPNSMDADLDLNGSNLINAESIYTDNLYVDGVRLVDATAIPVWKGAWSSGASYAKDDIVREDGSSYICLVAHTSGSFATDLTASKWALFASKGTAGDGTGDLLAANNLSDLASAATARANLGLGTVAVESTLPIAKGGTGATTASAALAAFGVTTHDQSVWDAGTATSEGTITPAKLRAAAPEVAATTLTSTFTTTSTTYTAITGLAATVTPKTTSSRVKVTVSISVSASTNQPWYIQLTRNGTAIALGDSAGSRERVTLEALVAANNSSELLRTYTFTYLDSPASSSALTYGLQVRGENRTAPPGTFYVNRAHTDTNAVSFARGISTIIVEEIL